jgi:membrane protein
VLNNVKTTTKRVQAVLRSFGTGHWDDLNRVEWSLAYPIILTRQVFRRLINDRGLARASSLALTTVLSAVPLLTVATALLGTFGAKNEAFLGVIQGLLPAVSEEEITKHLVTFTERQGGTVSGVGSVILIFLGVMLFNTVEQTFNDIWRVRRRRPLLNKFLTFYALITLAPLLLTISIVETARVQLAFHELHVLASFGYKLLPLGLAFLVFTTANKLLPYTEVRLGPAVAGGLVTALAFELAKYGFNIYVESFVQPTYNKVYGALGLIPIFMIWVYVCWILVLFGAELTYTAQNLRQILLPESLSEAEVDPQGHTNPLLGLEIIAPLAQHFQRGEGPLTLARIASESGFPVPLVRDVVTRLVRREVLLEVDASEDHEVARYIPRRPLEDISLLDILEICRTYERLHEPQPLVAQLHAQHQARERELLRGLTCASLANPNDPARQRLMPPSEPAPVSPEPSALTALKAHLLEAARATEARDPKAEAIAPARS